MVTAAAQAHAQGFGSVEEQMVFQELLRRGLKHGQDFTYQNRFFGGRLDKGGLIVDFLFSNPPDLAINVTGFYFHYQQGVEQLAQDRYAIIQLAQQGITLVEIDDTDIHQDVKYFVGEALKYRDHSLRARGMV